MSVLLQAIGIKLAFGGVQALNGVDLQLNAGEVVALIGPNGAGKSTLFNVINGQLVAQAGKVIFDGRDITRLSITDRAALGVGRTFQVAQVFASMTVQENLEIALDAHKHIHSHMHGDIQASLSNLLELTGLQTVARCPAQMLAYGDIKRLDFALALASQPKLLLLDEPGAGVGDADRHTLIKLARDIASERGTAVLFTEHSMDTVFTYADRIVVLNRGEIIANGTPQKIQSDPAVVAAYLGKQPVTTSNMPLSNIRLLRD
jgi:ABC-type branched-subunit amino acid transport system ATPase component